MITIISPAKNLNPIRSSKSDRYTIPSFIEESQHLVEQLRKLNVSELQKLMQISDNLAVANRERFLRWHLPFTPENAKEALFMFNGDVYKSLDSSTLTDEDLEEAQNKLRILSGLYGLLRPFDLIQEYRLEMGVSFDFLEYRNLYDFWSEKITKELNRILQQNDKILVNLASAEYFKVIDRHKISGRIITPIFKEFKDGTYKIVGIFAKKARGSMCRFIVKNRISNPEEMKHFGADGYCFRDDLSNTNDWIFTR